jgi:hypothetical protein
MLKWADEAGASSSCAANATASARTRMCDGSAAEAPPACRRGAASSAAAAPCRNMCRRWMRPEIVCKVLARTRVWVHPGGGGPGKRQRRERRHPRPAENFNQPVGSTHLAESQSAEKARRGADAENDIRTTGSPVTCCVRKTEPKERKLRERPRRRKTASLFATLGATMAWNGAGDSLFGSADWKAPAIKTTLLVRAPGRASILPGRCAAPRRDRRPLAAAAISDARPPPAAGRAGRRQAGGRGGGRPRRAMGCEERRGAARALGQHLGPRRTGAAAV